MNFDYCQFSKWNLSVTPNAISTIEMLGMKLSLLSGESVEKKTIIKSASETEFSIDSKKTRRILTQLNNQTKKSK